MRPTRDLGQPEPTDGKAGWYWASTRTVPMFRDEAHYYQDSIMSCDTAPKSGWALYSGYPAAEGDDLCPACLTIAMPRQDAPT